MQAKESSNLKQGCCFYIVAEAAQFLKYEPSYGIITKTDRDG
jgi:hypothetical protein